MMTRQMKSSGVEWIGDIPEKWDVCKVINCLLNIGSGTTPQGLEYYENEYIPWLNTGDLNDAYIEKTEKSVSEKALSDYSVLKRFDKGSVVVAMYGATVGKLGIVSFPLVTNQACCVMTPNEKLYNMFLFYLFMAGKTHLISLSLGSGQPNINQNTVKTFDIPFPSFSEQKEIADYLDAKCAKIDTFIAKQKTVIEKLKEYKQSVITEAVTKGLNPAAPMKISGVEWIGNIPKKWNVFRIKNVAFLKGRIGWQGLKSDEYQEDGPFLVTGKDFKNGKIDWMSCVHITEERFDEAPEIHIRENDLLITKDGTVGKVAIAKNCPLKVSLNSGVLLIRSKNNSFFDQKFLYYVLCSNIFWMWFLSTLNGNSTIIHLYQEDFSNFRFSLPPLSEQKEIADYLDAKCAKIDAFIAKKQTVIEKMTEYKKSLIYECVTGKREIV